MFLIKNWPQTDGTITGVDRQSSTFSGDNQDVYDYWVTYRVDRQEYRSKIATGNYYLYSAGQQITVAYDPDKPQKCIDGGRRKLESAKQITKLVILGVIVAFVLWVKWLFS